MRRLSRHSLSAPFAAIIIALIALSAPALLAQDDAPEEPAPTPAPTAEPAETAVPAPTEVPGPEEQTDGQPTQEPTGEPGDAEAADETAAEDTEAVGGVDQTADESTDAADTEETDTEDTAETDGEAAPTDEPDAEPSSTASASGGGGSATDAEAARREVRRRRSEAISQSIERLNTAKEDELSEMQRAALVAQIAQGARVELGSLREETAEAKLTLEHLQETARRIKHDRRTVPSQIRTGQIPSLGASNRWDALQETNTELQDAIDRAFNERLRLLNDIPEAEQALNEVQKLIETSSGAFDASMRQVLKDSESYLKQRLETMQKLLELYNKQAAAATEAYDNSSQYTEELSAAMVAARKRGLLARSDAGVSWDTFRAIKAGLTTLVGDGYALAEGYSESGDPADTMFSYVLRLLGTVLFLAVLVVVWLKLPGWLAAAFGAANGNEPCEDTDGGEDLQTLRNRRKAEIATPVARAGALAAIAALLGLVWGLPQAWTTAAMTVLGTWAAYFVLVAVMRQLLAPRHEELRIIPIDSAAAHALFRLLRALALWSAIILPIVWALSALDYPHRDVLVLLSVVHYVGLALIAGLMIYAAGGPGEFMAGAESGSARPVKRVVTTAVPIVLGLAAAVAILKAIGYVNLGAFLGRLLYLELPLLIAALVGDWQVRAHFAESSAWRTRLRAALWAAFGVAQIWVLGLRYHHWLAIVDFLKRPLFTVAENEVSAFSILRAITVILLAWLIAKLLRGWLENSTRIGSRVSEGVQYAVSSLTFYVILVAGILWAMLAGGFPLNALTVLAGMAGIGLGFGLQDVVRNFIAGLILLIERPLAVGDYVEVAGTWGRVMSISLRSTVVRTQDNAHILVPNGDIISNQLTNLSHHDRTLRLVIPVGVSYDSDIDEVIDILIEVAKENPNVRDFPEPGARLREFGDSAIVVELLVWISDPQGQIGTRVALNLEIWRACKREGIEIPFPQTDLHIREDSAPVRIDREWREPTDEQ